MMMTRPANNQGGAVSLIAVTLTSLLTLIITIALVGMMLGELRQSIDAENGVKAYYAAESGAEEAIYGIKDQLAHNVTIGDLNQECDNVISNGGPSYQYFNSTQSGINDTASGVQITCRAIHTNGSPVGILNKDEPTSFDLFGHNVASIQVNWDTNDPAAGGTIPDLAFTLAAYPTGNVAAVDSVPTKSILLQPCSPASGTCVNRTSSPYLFSLPGYAVATYCNTGSAPSATSYRCHAEIKNISGIGNLVVPGNFAVLRLRPQDFGASYSLKIIDDSNNSVNVRLQQATVDVTAKVGDSFRRIRQQIDVRSGVYAGLDVISSQTDVCKDFDYNFSPSYESVTKKNCALQ